MPIYFTLSIEGAPFWRGLRRTLKTYSKRSALLYCVRLSDKSRASTSFLRLAQSISGLSELVGKNPSPRGAATPEDPTRNCRRISRGRISCFRRAFQTLYELGPYSTVRLASLDDFGLAKASETMSTE